MFICLALKVQVSFNYQVFSDDLYLWHKLFIFSSAAAPPRRFKVNYIQPIPKVKRGYRFSNKRPRHFSFSEGKISLFQHNYDVLIYLNIILLRPLVARYCFLGEQSGPWFFFVIQIQRWRGNSITIKQKPNKARVIKLLIISGTFRWQIFQMIYVIAQ